MCVSETKLGLIFCHVTRPKGLRPSYPTLHLYRGFPFSPILKPLLCEWKQQWVNSLAKWLRVKSGWNTKTSLIHLGSVPLTSLNDTNMHWTSGHFAHISGSPGAFLMTAKKWINGPHYFMHKNRLMNKEPSMCSLSEVTTNDINITPNGSSLLITYANGSCRVEFSVFLPAFVCMSVFLHDIYKRWCS